MTRKELKRKVCDKTISGKHIWETFAYEDYSGTNGLLPPLYTERCRACGLVDDENEDFKKQKEKNREFIVKMGEAHLRSKGLL